MGIFPRISFLAYSWLAWSTGSSCTGNQKRKTDLILLHQEVSAGPWALLSLRHICAYMMVCRLAHGSDQADSSAAPAGSLARASLNFRPGAC